MDRPELAREWADALEQVIYIARAREDVEGELNKALDDLVDAMCAEPFDDAPVAAEWTARIGLTIAFPDWRPW